MDPDVVFFERETKEFHAIPVRANGDLVTTGVQFAITTPNARPQDWQNATLVGGQTGVMVENLTRGDYVIWAKVPVGMEVIVKKARRIAVR